MKGSKTRILVVDDEQHQLETIRRGLFLYGYDSVGALSAVEALEILRVKVNGRVDLMLTDLTMPEQSGLFLVKEARRLEPELPIIVITGLAATDELDRVQDMEIPILPKPFNPDHLAQAISRLLKV